MAVVRILVYPKSVYGFPLTKMVGSSYSGWITWWAIVPFEKPDTWASDMQKQKWNATVPRRKLYCWIDCWRAAQLGWDWMGQRTGWAGVLKGSMMWQYLTSSNFFNACLGRSSWIFLYTKMPDMATFMLEIWSNICLKMLPFWDNCKKPIFPLRALKNHFSRFSRKNKHCNKY